MQKQPSFAQKLVAEFIGTALLVLIGAGSVTAAGAIDGGSGAKFSFADLGIISFAFAFIIMAMVYTIGKVSGCHINPAVTIALALTGRIDAGSALGYIVAQVAGGIVGAFAIVATFGAELSKTLGVGVTSYGATVSPFQAIVAEAIGTFILVFTIYGIAVDSRAPAGWAGLVIGLIVAGIIFVVGPVTGAALNPARAFASELVQTIIGGVNHLDQWYVYLIGPVVGAVVGGFAYDFLAQPKAADAPAPAITEVKTAAAARS
jgi:glycerol uptake facilitator protein